jgi:hypothetical protein
VPDGDFKTRRVFFEYYWGLSEQRDDQVVAAGSLWGSGLPRVWVSGRNALVAGWATGRLTG